MGLATKSYRTVQKSVAKIFVLKLAPANQQFILKQKLEKSIDEGVKLRLLEDEYASKPRILLFCSREKLHCMLLSLPSQLYTGHVMT